jgi:sulfite exporter TauE/SafE
MIALLASVWVASLLGSVHCAGMCGGFVCAITTPRRAFWSQAAWHLGRGAAYVVLGLAAGFLGRGLESTLDASGIRHSAAIAAGALLVVRGITELWTRQRARPHRPAPWAHMVTHGIRAVRALPLIPRALLVGALAALLPCGWLWVFVTTAAGTGQPWLGGLVMLAFWAGTIPLLAGVGFAAGGLLARFRDGLPRATAIAMIVVGLLTVAGRFRAHPACHHATLPTLAPAAAHVHDAPAHGAR